MWIWDARTNRYSGPYDLSAATEMAEKLNRFVLPPLLAALAGKVEGPFYVRETPAS